MVKRFLHSTEAVEHHIAGGKKCGPSSWLFSADTHDNVHGSVEGQEGRGCHVIKQTLSYR